MYAVTKNSGSYVVESTTINSNGTNIWYRKWSDNFIEYILSTSGGKLITFPFPFATVYYQILTSVNVLAKLYVATKDKNVSNFSLRVESYDYASTNNSGWTIAVHVMGYAAS